MAEAHWLLYDGDCPFCSAYVRLVRLRAAIGPLAIADARSRPDLVREAAAQGMAIDTGMVLKLDGRYYHGADCMNRLALMTTASGGFNRLNRLMFRSPTLARVLYPVLRAGRNAALALLGRRRIAAD